MNANFLPCCPTCGHPSVGYVSIPVSEYSEMVKKLESLKAEVDRLHLEAYRRKETEGK